MNLRVKANTKSIRDLLAVVRDRRTYLEAAGLAMVSLAKRAHYTASLRPRPWPAKKDGTQSTLQDTTTLRRAHRIVRTTNESVTVGNDRPYAEIHQRGGKTRAHIIKPRKKKALAFGVPGVMGGVVVKSVRHPGSRIPARPHWPVTPAGRLTARGATNIGRAIDAKLRARLKAK